MGPANPGANRDIQALRTVLRIGWISLGVTRTVGDGRGHPQDAFKIRRIYRRLAKMRGRGHLHRLTVFIRHDNVVRLLEFLGYRVE